MKRILATLLALAMLLSLSAAAMAENDTVTFMVDGGTSVYEPYLCPTLVGMLKVQDLANVTIDWKVQCGTNEENTKAYLAMMSSGNYPDIIKWQHNNVYAGGISQLYNDGIAMALNDVIDQYMPNYKAMLDSHPDIAKALKNDDGLYLYFTAINPLDTPVDRMGITWWGLMLRQDWMEAVGIEKAPETIEEWEELLVAFRDLDPNGNGLQDEIPFDAGSAGHLLFMGAYDIMNGIYINPETNAVGYGQYTQNYKEYLETMNKWYSQGLIKNIYNEDGSLVGSDVVDQDIYADLAGSMKALANYWEQRLPQLLEKNPNANFEAVVWPYDANGQRFGGYGDFSYIDRVQTIITTSCKNVEAAARLLDTMFTPEGTDATVWGVMDGDPILQQPGNEWTKGEGTEFYKEEGNGSYYIDENGIKKNTAWGNAIVTDFYDGAFPNQFRYAMSHVSFPRLGGTDKNLSRDQNYIDASFLWSDCDFGLAFPSVIMLSVDEQKAAAPQLDEIGEYIEDMTRKFITGEEPLTNFDNYMDQLQKMGIEDLIAAYQAAYDRYLARGN